MTIHRRILLTLLAASLWNSGAAADRGVLAVRDSWPARLQKPATFWVNGKPQEATEVVMMRVAVPNPAAFMPRALPEPFFVLGNAVGEVLRPPTLDGEAVVAWPRSAATRGARLLIWSVEQPELVTDSNVARYLKTKPGRRASVAIRLNKSRALETYESLSDYAVQFMPRRSTPDRDPR